ncbi:MAG: WecB/TagA/CpsF family glycosyltransferase [Candidatus Berkelbacteria bacterium]|nr:WecB/TagA/CpsF family glycosyltransferase [Candidatus Berkelbacteria bacterium]
MKTYRLLNSKINALSKKELLDFVDLKIKNNEKAQISTVNNEFLVEANSNEKFQKVLAKSDLSIADSTGVVWAINRLYHDKIDRLPGADIFMSLCELSRNKGYRIFILGGERGAGKQTKQKLIKMFFGIHIVGVIDDVKVNENNQNDEIISEINKARPNIVFVALGAPKQEIWISNFKHLISANIFIGIGGTLDYVSGRVKRAPKFMRELGLEWLFRLFAQPSRIKRIYNATVVFPMLVIMKRKL